MKIHDFRRLQRLSLIEDKLSQLLNADKWLFLENSGILYRPKLKKRQKCRFFTTENLKENFDRFPPLRAAGGSFQ